MNLIVERREGKRSRGQIRSKRKLAKNRNKELRKLICLKWTLSNQDKHSQLSTSWKWEVEFRVINRLVRVMAVC